MTDTRPTSNPPADPCDLHGHDVEHLTLEWVNGRGARWRGPDGTIVDVTCSPCRERIQSQMDDARWPTLKVPPEARAVYSYENLGRAIDHTSAWITEEKDAIRPLPGDATANALAYASRRGEIRRSGDDAADAQFVADIRLMVEHSGEALQDVAPGTAAAARDLLHAHERLENSKAHLITKREILLGARPPFGLSAYPPALEAKGVQVKPRPAPSETRDTWPFRASDVDAAIERIGARLEHGETTMAKAKRIAREGYAIDKAPTREPSAYAAASLYIAGIIEQERRTQSAVSEAADTTDGTVRKVYRWLAEYADVDVIL